ncbi:MAG: hypothetical protein AB7E42_00155 [Anaerotignaceae bacterium]
MGHRIQKEFSSDRFKTMSRKMMGISEDVRICRDMAETIDEDNIAIRKVQKQTGQAVAELVGDLGDTHRDILTLMLRMSTTETNMWDLSSKLRKERQYNRDMRKWLEGYIKLLFAIVVCFIIAVFVS